jgi:catechol 2,3-dioxygenase-like lactoylglutathione lyase family enzyme
MSSPLIDHVQLPMPPGGATQARRFYGEVLGLPQLPAPAQPPGFESRVLRFGLQGLTLDLCEGRYTGVAPQAHLALRLRNLPSVLERLRAAGYPVDAWALADQGRASTEDPFGNRLEFIALEPEALLHVKDHHVTQLRISL